ncbi:hypothetical protein [Streptomyces inhibens]|uniref:hypothetical protein n=1 Tax=Streptomyces inhibens TaxID=2293571 RepID=UPI0015F26332|nr:hypothetical protein [Streptomyces inhibens]
MRETVGSGAFDLALLLLMGAISRDRRLGGSAARRLGGSAARQSRPPIARTGRYS